MLNKGGKDEVNNDIRSENEQEKEKTGAYKDWWLLFSMTAMNREAGQASIHPSMIEQTMTSFPSTSAGHMTTPVDCPSLKTATIACGCLKSFKLQVAV